MGNCTISKILAVKKVGPYLGGALDISPPLRMFDSSPENNPRTCQAMHHYRRGTQNDQHRKDHWLKSLNSKVGMGRHRVENAPGQQA